MEDTRKRPDRQTGGDCGAKRPREAKVAAEEQPGVLVGEEEIVEWLCEGEYYTVGELMKQLETEEVASSSAAAMKVRFVENPNLWTMMRFQASSSYVTINGNEESCGSSFSDSDSSVMASVDRGGVKFGSSDAGSEVERWLEYWTAEEGGTGACRSSADVARGSETEAVTKMEMDGGDWEDDLLARFLGEEDEH